MNSDSLETILLVEDEPAVRQLFAVRSRADVEVLVHAYEEYGEAWALRRAG